MNSTHSSNNQHPLRYPEDEWDERVDGSFVARWRHRLEERNALRLLAAPAFLAALGALLGYFIFAAGWNPTHAVARIRNQVNAAYSAKDYVTAAVGYRGLLQLQGAGEPEYRLRLALSQMALGRREEAYALMQRLAPLAKPGYAPAHLEVALSLLKATNFTAWSIPTAEQHLKHVVDLDPANAQAHELLGKLNLRMGHFTEAKKQLLEAVQTRNEAILPLAHTLKALGEDTGVRQWAERALRYYRGELERSVPNEVELRLALVETMLLLQDHAGAQTVLEAASKVRPDPTYETALGSVAALWATALAEQKPNQLALRLSVVQRGLEHDPQNLKLLEQLANLSRTTGPQAAAAREALDPILKDGGRAAWVHFFLGLRARQQGDNAVAREHYELAYELDPNLAFLANNLAVVLVSDKNPDLPRAFSLIDALVSKYPNNPHSRETRGQVLAKMGRYQEAVKDLEMALPGIQGTARLTTYAALSSAYRGLGMTGVAESYQRMAGEASGAPAAAPKPSP